MADFSSDIEFARRRLGTGAGGGRFDADIEFARRRLEQQPQPAVQEPQPQASQGPGSFFEDFSRATEATVRGAVEGIPIVGPQIVQGLDTAESGVRSLFSGKSWSEERTSLDAANKRLEQENPIARGGGNLGGGVATFGALAAANPAAFGLQQGGSYLSRALPSAASSAAISGADAAGRKVAEGGTISDAAEAALPAAAVGAAVGFASPWIADRISKMVPAREAPGTPKDLSMQVLRDKAQAAYKAADDVGLVIDNKTIQAFGGQLRKTLATEGYHARVTPRSKVVLDTLSKIQADAVGGAGTSLRELDNVRKLASNLARAADGAEAHVARQIVSSIDDFVLTLPDTAVRAGNAQQAQAVIKQARSLWRDFKNGQVIEDALARADVAPNYTVGLINEFRRIARDQKVFKGFSKADQAAIKSIINRTTGPASFVTNVARIVGMNPDSVFSRLLGPGIGFGVGGIPGAIAVGGAQALAGRETTRAAQQLLANQVRGGPAPVNETARTLGQALSGAVGLEGARRLEGR